MDLVAAAVVGFALGGTAVWLLGRRGSSAPISLASGHRSIAPLRRTPHRLPPGELEALVHNAERLAHIDASPLQRVIGVGKVSVAQGVTVELLAIEVREAGCRGLLRFRTPGEASNLESFMPMGPPEVTVADDRATRYETGAASMSQSDTGGEAGFNFAPPPPADARRLMITIGRFEGRAAPPGSRIPAHREVPGLWTFEVELTRGPDS